MAGQGRTKGFRLDLVLEHRRRLTDKAEQVLALRERERHDAEAELESLRQERESLLRSLEITEPDVAVDVTSLMSAEIRDLQLRHIAFQQAQAVMEAEIRETAARQDLLGRRVDQKVLEKLRDKHVREQEVRLRYAEDQLIDEIATMQHGARQKAINGGGA
jgi:flagellar export protein FliJ